MGLKIDSTRPFRIHSWSRDQNSLASLIPTPAGVATARYDEVGEPISSDLQFTSSLDRQNEVRVVWN